MPSNPTPKPREYYLLRTRDNQIIAGPGPLATMCAERQRKNSGHKHAIAHVWCKQGRAWWVIKKV